VTTPAAMPTQLGRYRILHKLGAGGMGTVYLAEDSEIGRRVALKVPHFDASAGSEVLDRFRREARVAGAIEHPHICPIYDVGVADGYHYLVMPYIEGTPLSHRIHPDQPWSVPPALSLVRQLALAIEVMHQRGIIHRDLKPANVMLRPSGEPVLMDFGLARSASQRLTHTGQALGTPAYMAPEQVLGAQEDMGPATDVYSLGVILYELVTGTVPFHGPIHAVWGQKLHGTPRPPSAERPDIDPELDALCLRAMAREVKDRPASMAVFLAALTECLQSRGSEPPPKTARLKLGLLPDMMLAAGLTGTLTVRAQRAHCPGVIKLRLKGLPEGVRSSKLAILEGADAATLELTADLDSTPATRTVRLIADGDGARDQLDFRVTIGKEFTNSIGMKLVRISHGKFKMGSPERQPGYFPFEMPQHEVEISRSFYLGVYTVTVGQFRQFAQETDYKTEAEKVCDPNTWLNVGWEQSDDHPVVYVTGYDAVQFCQWLGRKEQRTYELPTQAEWEYACRAGTETTYFFGTDVKKLTEYAWFSGNSGNKAHTVGQKKANPWGLFDMLGNVWQLCDNGPKKYDLDLRGGSCSDPDWVCRADFHLRGYVDRTENPQHGSCDTGFRVVLRPALRTP
jgi:formylglycine-generating enzyme required for sulfatase activity